MSRIFWKPAQKLLVAQRAFALLKDPLFTGSELDAVRDAQLALDPSLHRDITGMQAVTPWIQTIWRELESNGFATPKATIVPQLNPNVEHEREARRVHQLSEFKTEDLLGEFFKRMTDLMDPANIREMVRTEVNAMLERRLPGVLAPDEYTEPEAPAPDSKHRVCIIGLIAGQPDVMLRKYKGVIDFHFIDGSEGHNRVKGIVQTMDYTIRTKWCKGNLGSTHGWSNYTMCNGGLESIQRLINERFHIKDAA